MSLRPRRRRRDATVPARRPAVPVVERRAVGVAAASALESLESRRLMAATVAAGVFVDANGNGRRDGGESGLAGVTVFADANANGRLDGGEKSTVTGSDGSYQITNLPTGISLQVQVVLPDGYAQTTPSSGEGYWFKAYNGMYNTSATFGLKPTTSSTPTTTPTAPANPTSASVASYVFVDANGNGSRDASEAGLAGATVFADANANGTLDAGERSATTAADGTYRIDDLPLRQSVQVRLIAPAGYAQTNPSSGAGYWFKSYAGMLNTSTVFGAKPTTSSPPPTTTPTTPVSPTSASVASYVFADADGDGVRDASEAGLGGATVFVDVNANGKLDAGELSTTTAADGTYRIDNLPLNQSIAVRLVAPSGYVQTTPAVNGGYWFRAYAGMLNTSTAFGAKPTGNTSSGGGGSSGGGSSTPATGASIPQVGNAASPVARITAVSTTSLVVGQSAHFDGLSSSLNYGDVTTARFEWTFGDPSGNYNTLVGFNASHVFDRTGTYTVTLRVINEAGKSATATTTVSVAADNRATIYVSASGNDGYDGSSESRAVRTYERAVALLGTRSDVRVLFRRGDTFLTSKELVVRGNDVTIGTYGSGSSPVIRYNGPRDSTPRFLISTLGATETTIQGLTFDSIFASDTDQTNMPTALMLMSNGVTIRDNVFLNVGYAINAGGTTTGVIVQGNSAPSATGVRGYFVYAAGASNLTIVGNTVANSTREHNIRTVGSSRVLIYDNDLTNLDRRNVDADDFAKNTINIQKGAYVYVAGNELNGPGSFGPLGTAANIAEAATRTSYVVFEANHQASGTFQVLHGAEHVMIRSNVFDQDNDYQLSVQGYDSSFKRGVVDVKIINNTGLNEGSQGGFLRTYSPVDGIVLLNNLYVAPNLVTGAYMASPVQVWDTDGSNFTRVDTNIWSDPVKLAWAQGGINWLGMAVESSSYLTPAEWNALPKVGTDLFVDVSVTSNYTPVGSASVTESGTAVGGVFVDYYGNWREVGEWTIGAVEI